MRKIAALSLLLCLAALSQGLEIFTNPEMDGCEISNGTPVTAWTVPGGPGSYKQNAFPYFITSTIPAGDLCYVSIDPNPQYNMISQTINIATKGTYDFTGLVACYSTSPARTCGYTLTIDGNDIPLTGASGIPASNPAPYQPISASAILLDVGTHNVVFRIAAGIPSGVAAYTTKLSLQFVAAVSGDPHMVGFQGQQFDYIGEPGQVINLVTDPELQVNSLLGLQQYGINSFLPGPVMMQMAFITRAHTVIVNAGGYLKEETGFVSVDGVLLPLGQSFLDGILSVAFTALNINSKDLGLTGKDHIVAQVDVKLEGLYEFRVFMIENGRNKFNSDRWNYLPRRFLDFNASLLDLDRRPHGVLGQTAAPLGKERSVNEWTIEGKDEDYVVKDGLTGTQFSFNLFL